MTEPTDHASAAPAEVNENDPTALPASSPPEPGESTVGTGTVFALGCTIATVILILLGILVIYLLR